MQSHKKIATVDEKGIIRKVFKKILIPQFKTLWFTVHIAHVAEQKKQLVFKNTANKVQEMIRDMTKPTK